MYIDAEVKYKVGERVVVRTEPGHYRVGQIIETRWVSRLNEDETVRYVVRTPVQNSSANDTWSVEGKDITECPVETYNTRQVIDWFKADLDTMLEPTVAPWSDENPQDDEGGDAE